MKIKRVIAYVDGFNLYFGLRDKGWRCYYWLNLWKLCQHLLKPDQKLISVNYFTSKIKEPADKRKRQNAYLQALRMTPGIERFFGKYETISYTCNNCGHQFESQQEKMTDVQIASQLVSDAFKDKFDVALLLSGDRDLVPAIEVVSSEFPTKRTIAVFPPMRSCDDLRYTASGFIHVTETELKKSLFPDVVSDSSGRSVCRPQEWA